jgi:hypothetical protein
MSKTINTELSLERAIMAFAGFMMLLSLGLTVWLSPHFIWLSVFVGANLLQSSFTGLCPAAKVMSILGIKTEAQLMQEKTATRKI